MFTVKDGKILKDGSPYQIRGFNLGNWMNLERYMFGFPGVDHLFRGYLREHGGEDRYNAFFDRYYKVFFSEKDARFLKEMGCNTLRLPLNYRRFERDSEPFIYDETAFAYVDELIELCKAQGIAVILDYHSAQGCQTLAHCGDNISGEMPFYHDAFFRQRFCALWKHIAQRYKDEEMVLGYDVMNEPTPATAAECQAMREAYQEAITAIRSVDRDHILILEGAGASYDFTDLEGVADQNIVFSPHIYFSTKRYVGTRDRQERKVRIAEDLDRQNAVAARRGIPVYYGETGLSSGDDEDYLLDCLDITLELCNERGYGWTLWSYKDLWRMGLVVQKEDSPWWELVRPAFEMKKRYGMDYHVHGARPFVNKLFAMIDEDFDHTPSTTGHWRSEAEQVKSEVWTNLVNALGKVMAEDFAKLFAGLSQDEMERVVDSFDFDNCKIKKDWYEVIHSRLQ